MKKNNSIIIAIAFVLLLTISVFAIYIYRNATPSNDSIVYQTLTVFYVDGTSKTFSPLISPALSIIDVNSGKSVSSIQIELYATPTFTREISSYSTSGSFTWQLRQGTTVLFSVDMPLQSQNNPISSGQSTVITSSTLTSTDLENMYSYTHGDTYNLFMSVNSFSMSLNFVDGYSQSKSASVAPLNWQFEYLSDYYFSSLAITWGTYIT